MAFLELRKQPPWPGSGRDIDDDRFVLFEGLNLVAEQCRRSLQAFQELDGGGKKRCRQQAILYAAKEAPESGKAALVVGHYMFWENETAPPELVWTETDATTFTHIVYLQVNAETILQRREADTRRHRPRLAADHLHTWQQREIQELRQTCYKSGILFTVIANADRLPSLLENFQLHNEDMNATWATSALDKGLSSGNFETPTALVFDGDKTLVSEDSGTMFFDKTTHHQDALKALFESAGYSYTSFRQAMLLCEEVADD